VACTTRIPYATLIAALLCFTGIGIFCGTMYRGATLSALMMDQVFHLYIGWYSIFLLIYSSKTKLLFFVHIFFTVNVFYILQA
jgi:hypothetical protein